MDAGNDVSAREPGGVTLEAVREAHSRIGRYVDRTPLIRSAWLSARAGAEVWLKLETFQRTASFKIRGALNAALRLAERGGSASLVTASAGNHGRALAEAARLAGMPCLVFTPRSAPRAKTQAIREAGAMLDDSAADYDAAERAARLHAARTGDIYISPYNHADVIAGAGTIGLELVEDLPGVDAAVVPIGGGGLAAGTALALRALVPSCHVVGVEAAANPAFREARARGGITPIDVGDSLADGLLGNLEPGSITFELVERHVAGLATVDEDAIASAVRGLVRHEHLVAEGAGAVAVAAVAAGRIGTLRGRRVAVVVSGANIDMSRLLAVLGGARA
jgi:threonine dehydratase